KADRTEQEPSANADDPLYHPLPAWNCSLGDDRKALINQPVEDIVEFLTDPIAKRGHVLIKGPAGLGKTALLNKVVRRLLEEFDQAPTRRPLPVYLAAEGGSIEERLKKGLGAKALIVPELLPTYLNRGWFVLVADNISESGPSESDIDAFHGKYHH